MKIHEYQAKAILARHGVPVPRGEVAFNAAEAGDIARRLGGRIVVVGTMGGTQSEIDLVVLLRKRAELRGTMLRSRPLEEKILAARALQRHLVPLFSRGLLRPVVDRVMPLAQAAEAHRLVQSNATFGKLVLET